MTEFGTFSTFRACRPAASDSFDTVGTVGYYSGILTPSQYIYTVFPGMGISMLISNMGIPIV